MRVRTAYFANLKTIILDELHALAPTKRGCLLALAIARLAGVRQHAAQAELVFRELWSINEDALPIALHHGSLDVGQRRKVEEAMAQNALRAVVATSTLDLGIDWGDVDLVIHVGAPKGASRLAQRIGRSNHRMDEPSKAILVPANRFEVLECQAALKANYDRAQDTPPIRDGALDVLAQHMFWAWPARMPFQLTISMRRYARPIPTGC
jgi:Lhr-like helicase